jgi:hypothetical protein
VKSVAVRIRNRQADVLGDDLDGGYLRVYQHGGSVPASVNAALGGATMLAELTFANPAMAGPAAGGMVTANPINSDPSANESGTAHFYRTFNAADEVVEQGTVGRSGSGADMIVTTTQVAQGVEFEVTSYTHLVP